MREIVTKQKKQGKPKVIGGLLLALSLILAGVGTIFYIAFIFAGLMLFIFFMMYPVTLLWGYFVTQWLMYVPHLGKKIEHAKVSLGSVNITPDDMFFLMFCLLILMGMIQRPGVFKRALHSPIGKLVAVFLGYQVLQMLWSMFMGVPLDTVIREGVKYLVCVYLFYIYLYFDREQINKFAKFAYYLIMLMPIFQVYMLATGAVWYTSSGTERTYFIGANILYLLVIIYHLMADKFDSRTLLIFAYMVGGMIMTQYRSAFLSLIVVIMISSWFMFRRGQMNRLIMGSMGMAFLAMIAITAISFVKPDYFNQVITRYTDTFNTEDVNVSRRQAMWELSLDTFISNPIFGVGVAKPIEIVAAVREGTEEIQWSPHNFIMRILAKEGAIGTILVLMIWWVFYRQVTSRDFLRQTNAETQQRFVLAIVMIFVINLMNTTFTYSRTSFIFWMLIGVFMVLQRETKEDEKPENSDDKTIEKKANSVLFLHEKSKKV